MHAGGQGTYTRAVVRRCFVLTAGLAVAFAVATARGQARPVADDPAAILTRAREALTYAQFPDAIRLLEPLVGRADLPARQRVGALETLAESYIASNRSTEARRTVETLFALDPGHNLSDPDASPPISRFFAKIKRDFRPPEHVRLQHQPISNLSTRTAVRVVVFVEAGADAIDELRLIYGSGSDPSRARVTLAGAAERSAVIPVIEVGREAYTVEYRIEAVAPSGFVLASAGSDRAPLTFRVPSEAESLRRVGAREMAPAGPTPPRPSSGGVFGQWWFWTAVGVVAVAAGGGAYVVLNQPSPPRSGTLGNERVP